MRSPGYTVSGPAVPDAADVIHRLCGQVRSEHPDLDGSDLMLLETAAVELLNNVVQHGTGGHRHDVAWQLDLDVTGEVLHATLTDNGCAFRGDLGRVEMPDVLDESGRGVAMAQAALDELHYHRSAGSNRWELLRRRATPTPN
jgi:serine/threonine-protein kinase RsbW